MRQIERRIQRGGQDRWVEHSEESRASNDFIICSGLNDYLFIGFAVVDQVNVDGTRLIAEDDASEWRGARSFCTARRE